MIPFLGCKSRFASELLANIPEAENFYDLFGGGGSIAEAAHKFKENGIFGKWQKWKYIHYNEINKSTYKLCRALWSGAFNFKLAKETQISYERFFAERNLPTAWGAFVRHVWSFGNKGDSFIYTKNKNCAMGNEHLQRIKRMEQSPILPDIETTCKDYRKVNIAANSVVYCDIPYNVNRNHYKQNFNHLCFYKWAATRKFPVYFSDYSCNDNRFKLVWEKCVPIKINTKLYKNKALYKIEKLFWNGVKLK